MHRRTTKRIAIGKWTFLQNVENGMTSSKASTSSNFVLFFKLQYFSFMIRAFAKVVALPGASLVRACAQSTAHGMYRSIFRLYWLDLISRSSWHACIFSWVWFFFCFCFSSASAVCFPIYARRILNALLLLVVCSSSSSSSHSLPLTFSFFSLDHIARFVVAAELLFSFCTRLQPQVNR